MSETDPRCQNEGPQCGPPVGKIFNDLGNDCGYRCQRCYEENWSHLPTEPREHAFYFLLSNDDRKEIKPGKKICTCDFAKVIMVTGCKCGGS